MHVLSVLSVLSNLLKFYPPAASTSKVSGYNFTPSYLVKYWVFSIKLYIFERFRSWGFQRCTFCMVNFLGSKIHNFLLNFFAICFTNIFIWVIVKYSDLVNLSNKKIIIIKDWKTGQKSTLLSFTAQAFRMDFNRQNHK